LTDDARVFAGLQDAQPAASKDMQVSRVFTLMISGDAADAAGIKDPRLECES
jgi:hypothetical protein